MNTDVYHRFLQQHPGYGYGGDTSVETPAVDAKVSGTQACGERRIDQVRREELRRLLPSADHAEGLTPLDHAGSALYSEVQLQQVFQELQAHMLCNPHSASTPSSLSVRHRSELIRHTLAMCNAPSDQYAVVFTSGATAAMKLVAEGLPWCPRSRLVHYHSTHNSVLGMRQVVLAAGGGVQVVDPTALPASSHEGVQLPGPGPQQGASGALTGQAQAGDQTSRPPPPQAGVLLQPRVPLITREAGGAAALDKGTAGPGPEPDPAACVAPAVHLAVLPHECNFTGQQLDLRLVDDIQAGRQLHWLRPGPQGLAGGPDAPPLRWLVLLDAAKSCASSPPDLQRHPADFVALSFYKIMGSGALLVHKGVLPLLTVHKAYFGGGTVAVSVADEDWVVRRPGASGLEDGTPPFAAIAAACHGFRFLQRLGGFPAVADHTRALSEHLSSELQALRHSNGLRLAVMYGREPGTPGVVGWGPTVTFNLVRPDGSWVGYTEVSRLADLHGIQLRTGCFCNPGACAQHLGLSGADLRENYDAGHVCWDERDVIRGRPTGAVRVSLGHVSSYQDVSTFLRFIRQYFLDPDACPASPPGVPTPPTQDKAADGLHASNGDRKHDRPCQQTLQRASPAAAPQDGARGQAHTQLHEAAVSRAAEHAQSSTAVPGAARHSSLSTPSSCPHASPPDMQPDRVHASHSGSVGLAQPCATLASIYVYPIKSCAAQQVTRWLVGPSGLLYDREWALVHDTGRAITQKSCPRAALVQPCIDLTAGTLTITAPNMAAPLVVPLNSNTHSAATATAAAALPLAHNSTGQEAAVQELAQVSICGDSVCSAVVATVLQPALQQDGGCDSSAQTTVRGWLEEALGVPCVLVQQRGGQRVARGGTGGTGRPPGRLRDGMQGPAGDAPWPSTQAQAHIGFANDGQYLLVSAASVADVNARISAAPRAEGVPPGQPVELLRFRPNLVVEGLSPYAEDLWTRARVGGLSCQVLGTCPRCEMLQVDQTLGTRGRPDVLLALAQYRRYNGRMHFGILLSAADHGDGAGDDDGSTACLGAGVARASAFGQAGHLRAVWLAVGDQVAGS